MRYQTHLLTSVTAGVALTHFTAIEPSVGLFVGILAGSLLPDIDEPQSYVGRRTSVQVMNKRVGLSSVIKSIFGHRGFTHSLLATLFVFIPYFFSLQYSGDFHVFAQTASMGLGFGYLFHILGDMLSKSGVPLFMPITKKKIKIPLYITGNFSEKIIFFLSAVALMYLVYLSILTV